MKKFDIIPIFEIAIISVGLNCITVCLVFLIDSKKPPFKTNDGISFCREVELKSKVEKLEESLNSMVSVRNEVNNKNKNLQSLLDELRERDVTWTTENSGLKSKLVFEQHCIKEIKSQLEKEQVKKESLKIKNKKLCECLKTLEMRYETVEAQRKEIHEMNESLQNGNIKLEAQCKSMEINLAELSNENADLKGELKKREEEVRAFVEDENNIEVYLKERYTAFTSLQAYYAKLEVVKNEVEKERDKLKNDIEILSKSKENAEKGNQGLEEKLSQCQFLFIENDEKYAAIMERVNTLMKQNITYETTIKQMNEQIIELKHNCQEHVYNEEKLRTELIETTQRLEKSFDENEEIRAKLTESLRKITITMEEEESKLREEYKIKDVKIEHLSRKVKECEEIIEANKTQMFNSNERVNLLSAKVECLTAEILKLKQEQEQLIQQIGKKILYRIKKATVVFNLPQNQTKMQLSLANTMRNLFLSSGECKAVGYGFEYKKTSYL